MKANEFSVGKKKYELHYVKGSVIDIQKTNTNNRLSEKIFINQENGEEYIAELYNWDIACRQGHSILLIWVVEPDKDGGPYVVFKNISTNNITIQKQIIENLSQNSLINAMGCKMQTLIFLLIGLIGGGIGASQEINLGLTLVLPLVLYIIYLKTKSASSNKEKKTLEKKVNELIEQVGQ